MTFINIGNDDSNEYSLLLKKWAGRQWNKITEVTEVKIFFKNECKIKTCSGKNLLQLLLQQMLQKFLEGMRNISSNIRNGGKSEKNLKW